MLMLRRLLNPIGIEGAFYADKDQVFYKKIPVHLESATRSIETIVREKSHILAKCYLFYIVQATASD